MRISDWSSYVCSSDLILLAPLLQLLTSKGQIIGGPAHGMLGMDRRIASVNLWATAITMDMFLMSYVPAIEARMVDRACLFTLTDKAEQRTEAQTSEIQSHMRISYAAFFWNKKTRQNKI